MAGAWYGLLAVLHALASCPALWPGAASHGQDRRALAALLACSVAYDVGPGAQVMPRSVHRGSRR